MTGFGEAHRQSDSVATAVEVRTINSRYFKLALRSGEGYSSLEPQIESVVRQFIKRGTVQVSLRVDRAHRADDFRFDAVVLDGYRKQLEQLAKKWNVPQPVNLEALLSLPGVVLEDSRNKSDVEKDWSLIRDTLQAAMEHMTVMRAEEGKAMAADLQANCLAIMAELNKIEERVPHVGDAYRSRLTERLTKTLAEFEISLSASDLVREVSIYAERSDISEEIVRLRSHLDQFVATMAVEESSGRKLEFLTQEMFRETNTIGSKANDIEISRHVIEVKAAIERIREMIQNVE